MRVRVPLQVPFDLLQFEALDLAVQGTGGNRQSSNKEADGEWRIGGHKRSGH